jgi:hypothetical protein
MTTNLTNSLGFYIGDFIGRLIVNPRRILFYPLIITISSFSLYHVYVFIKRRIVDKKLNEYSKTYLLKLNTKLENFKSRYYKAYKEDLVLLKLLDENIHNSIPKLIENFKSQKIKVEENLIHSINRINEEITINPKLIRDVNYEQCLIIARAFDKQLKSFKDFPSLLVLPIIINEQISIKGTVSN